MIADVYTRYVPNCPKNGVLYEGVGPVNAIFVVVEINGFLYLTRGATFSHYEFIEHNYNRLTDESWEDRIISNKLPPIHSWFKSLKLPTSKMPVVDESQTYRPDF